VLFINCLVGTILGMMIFSRKKLNKFPMRRVYTFLFVMDAFYLIKMVIQKTFAHTSIGSLKYLSNFACKLILYTNFMMCPVSSWLLVAISIERCLTIVFGNRIQILKNKKFEISLIALVIIYNCLLYTPFLAYQELQQSLTNSTDSNETQIEYNCEFTSIEYIQTFYLMDMINSTLAPYGIMLVSSIILIVFVVKSRIRVRHLENRKEKKSLMKEIRFGMTVLLMNFFFAILNLPICVANYNDTLSDFVYDFFAYIFLTSFSINFYILIGFNTIIRKEEAEMFKCFGNFRNSKNTIYLINLRKRKNKLNFEGKTKNTIIFSLPYYSTYYTLL
jgi:hypothetical protein